jgi:hypothetical protein
MKSVIWIQGGVSFLLWIAYGVIQSRRSHLIRKQVESISPTRRGILGASLFLVGAMVLIGGLAIILQNGGFTPGGLTPLAWLGATTLGLAFVHAQTMGMAMLVSLIHVAVTNASESTSFNRAPEDQEP